MNGDGIDVDVESFDAREIPTPPHSWETAKRCIRTACDADEHEWVELTDRTGEPYYWRECRTCGIADVTAAAVGQDVETPNADQQERCA